MRVSEVMTAMVEVCNPGDTLQAVADKMQKLDIGALPVCENDRLVGMITDRDICIRAVARGEDPKSCLVRDAMTPGIIYCSPDDSVRDAAELMSARQVRRLAVIDDQKRLCGIVALGDVAVEGRDDKLSGRVLEHISEPPPVPAM